MPKLEHINLAVRNMEPTLGFLKAAFPGWRNRGEGSRPWYGHPQNWLHFGDDDFYLTLNDNAVGEQRDLKGHAPGLAHIGFEVPSLDRLIERLRVAGFEPDHMGEDHPHRRNVYYLDGEGLEFEFVEYFSYIPEEKNLYV